MCVQAVYLHSINLNEVYLPHVQHVDIEHMNSAFIFAH